MGQCMHVHHEGYSMGSVYAQMSFMGVCWPQSSPKSISTTAYQSFLATKDGVKRVPSPPYM